MKRVRNLRSKVRCSGVLRIEVREANRLIQSWEQTNLVTRSGKDLIASRMAGTPDSPLTHFAVGTEGNAANLIDVALGAEVFRDRLTAKTLGTAQLVCSYYLPTTGANGHTLREAGLFNAASGPTMYSRTILSLPIVKTVAITVTFTWTLTWT